MNGIGNMSNTLKCSACNIVIDELLSYIQNKISVMDEITLVRICKTSFSSEEIQKSKSLLFDSLATDVRKISRKRQGKEVRDLEDIINLFKITDPNDIPIFVARQLEKLPPITFDHLDCTKLLKDLLLLKEEIELVKTSYVSVKQFEELRSEIFTLKNESKLNSPTKFVNTKMGALVANSESIINGTANMSVIEVNNVCNKYQENVPISKKVTRNNSESNISSCEQGTNYVNEQSAVVTHHDMHNSQQRPAARAPPVSENKTTVSCDDKITSASAPSEVGSECDEQQNSGWNTVTYKNRQSYRYKGKAGIARDVEGSFKAAERKVPIFISNVHKDTLTKDIVSHIQCKTKELVSLERINTKKQKDHYAFKFFVSETKLSLFLDETIWPKGIIFRRFVHYKPKYANTLLVRTAVNKTCNA